MGTLAVCAAVFAAACGGEERAAPRPVTVALDFTPNPVHAPIFAARAEGLDRRHGVPLRIRAPGSAPDSLKLLEAGRVDLGVLDIQDLGLARERGVDVVAVGALVDRPLAALIAHAAIARPRDLEGRRVGVSGLPSDPAVVRAVVAGDGGDPRRVRYLTVGFGAVRSLIAGRIDAAPVFWNAEGVALRLQGARVREFRLERFGAPRFPEVVLVTSRSRLRHEGATIGRALAAIADGIAAVRRDPERATSLIVRAGGGDRRLVRAQLDAVLPVFADDLRVPRSALAGWADFAVRFGILRRRPALSETFALRLRSGADVGAVGHRGTPTGRTARRVRRASSVISDRSGQ